MWEVTEDARMYEAPPEFEEADTSFENVFRLVREEFEACGQDLVSAVRGETSPHACLKCKRFWSKNNFNKWLLGPRCSKQTAGHDRKAASKGITIKRRKRLASRERSTQFEIRIPTTI